MVFSFVFTLLTTLLIREAYSHGYIQVPAARNSMWRYGFDNAPNYDLMGLAAGGPGVVSQHGHGLCGDNINEEQRHMSGGIFGNGIITAQYVVGQTIDIEIVVTAHHKGYFQFRLCDLPEGSSKRTRVTQRCLDRNVLKLADGSGTKWRLPASTGSTVTYKMAYKLPGGVTCSRCVLQWYWETGNSPGAYPEEFWNCADIRIKGKNGSIDATKKTKTQTKMSSNSKGKTKSNSKTKSISNQKKSNSNNDSSNQKKKKPNSSSSNKKKKKTSNDSSKKKKNKSKNDSSKGRTSSKERKLSNAKSNSKSKKKQTPGIAAAGGGNRCVSVVSHIPTSWCVAVGCTAYIGSVCAWA
eukprot:Awhi_evm1s9984